MSIFQRWTKEPPSRQLDNGEYMLKVRRESLPELRCARWPHCGCEGHVCGEVA